MNKCIAIGPYAAYTVTDEDLLFIVSKLEGEKVLEARTSITEEEYNVIYNVFGRVADSGFEETGTLEYDPNDPTSRVFIPNVKQ